MSKLNFNYQHPLFKNTIQLYGDRVGGQGNFEFAGLAEVNETKIILLYGNAQSLEHPADWRRCLRLTDLAQRLKKPVVLWNLNIIQAATTQHHTSLAVATAIQNSKIRLLRLLQPIITVYDDDYEWNNDNGEIGWTDGCVLVEQDKSKLSTASKVKQQNLEIVSKQIDIPNQIVKLLNEVYKKSEEELLADRFRSLSIHERIP